MINYYKEMWRGQRGTVEVLTVKTTRGVKFEWTPKMDAVFKQIKAILAEDTILLYPQHGERFHVHTEASNKQMGGIVSQKGNHVSFFLRKLNSA